MSDLTKDQSGLAIKALSLLFALSGALATMLWLGLRQDVALLQAEAKGIDKRLSVLETIVGGQGERNRELRNALGSIGEQVSRIEKGLLRKGIIKP